VFLHDRTFFTHVYRRITLPAVKVRSKLALNQEGRGSCLRPTPRTECSHHRHF
jgi:hypothetical protein